MEPLTQVGPTKTPAAYQGGKRALANTIVNIINKTPHTGYAEPFLGMGGVFLRRTHKPRTEVVNDISKDVATLFRILQRHYPQFMDCLKFQITSRTEFERLAATDPETLTDLERAARFIYLQKTNYGGKIDGRTFGVDKSGSGRFNVNHLGLVLEDIHERLAGVIIERLPYADFIRRYDREGMLFYLDPPYFGGENDYGKGIFERDDFTRLAKQLRGIKGEFILSINDCDEIRETFKGFEMEEVSLTYSIAGGKGTKARELIVKG